MSYDTHKNFFFEHFGRKLRMWQLQSGGSIDTLGGYKIKLPDDTYGSQLVYPDEDITDGIRIEYTSLDEPFIAEALETTTVVASGTTISLMMMEIVLVDIMIYMILGTVLQILLLMIKLGYRALQVMMEIIH